MCPLVSFLIRLTNLSVYLSVHLSILSFPLRIAVYTSLWRPISEVPQSISVL